MVRSMESISPDQCRLRHNFRLTSIEVIFWIGIAAVAFLGSISLLVLNMYTQNRFVRALRYATCALFLAAGLEELSFPRPVKSALARSST